MVLYICMRVVWSVMNVEPRNIRRLSLVLNVWNELSHNPVHVDRVLHGDTLVMFMCQELDLNSLTFI